MGKEESIITSQIRQYLTLKRVFHWKVWQGLGSQPGVSDIIGIFRGRPLAIEVKTKKGRVSEHQENFLNNFRENGGIAIIARSVDDVIQKLQEAENHG